jgi:hypothetical protein
MRFGRGAPTQPSSASGGGLGGGSPSGAPPRRSPKRPNASAQPRPRFTRRRGRRRYPRRRSRLSGAPRAPVVVPEGSMPEPPEARVARSKNRIIFVYQSDDCFEKWYSITGKYIGITLEGRFRPLGKKCLCGPNGSMTAAGHRIDDEFN